MVVGKPRDDKQTTIDRAFAFFPANSMVFVVFFTLISYAASGENLTLQVLLLVFGLVVSVFFGVTHNQKKGRKIQADEYGAGEVVYAAAVVRRWFWSLLVQMFVAFFLTFPWFVASLGLSRSLIPATLTWFFVWIWLSLSSWVMPTHYYVTEEGIWIRKRTDHSYVSFGDLDFICYDANKTRFQLTTGSPKWSSCIKCDGFIILSIKPERKLQKEYRQQAITVENPQIFLDHVPQNLVINECN